jgi:hypothetical protein
MGKNNIDNIKEFQNICINNRISVEKCYIMYKLLIDNKDIFTKQEENEYSSNPSASTYFVAGTFIVTSAAIGFYFFSTISKIYTPELDKAREALRLYKENPPTEIEIPNKFHVKETLQSIKNTLRNYDYYKQENDFYKNHFRYGDYSYDKFPSRDQFQDAFNELNQQIISYRHNSLIHKEFLKISFDNEYNKYFEIVRPIAKSLMFPFFASVSLAAGSYYSTDRPILEFIGKGACYLSGFGCESNVDEY